jgi:hypothetical protein
VIDALYSFILQTPAGNIRIECAKEFLSRARIPLRVQLQEKGAQDAFFVDLFKEQKNVSPADMAQAVRVMKKNETPPSGILYFQYSDTEKGIERDILFENLAWIREQLKGLIMPDDRMALEHKRSVLELKIKKIELELAEGVVTGVKDPRITNLRTFVLEQRLQTRQNISYDPNIDVDSMMHAQEMAPIARAQKRGLFETVKNVFGFVNKN